MNPGQEQAEEFDRQWRTSQQNNALHLMFERLADELNSQGMDMKAVLKPEVDIPWDKRTVKEYLWRPLQKAMLRKDSTTELNTDEVDKVFKILQKHFGEMGIEIHFPSIKTIMEDYAERV